MLSFEDLILMIFPLRAEKQSGPSRLFASEKSSRGISRQRIAEGALLYKYAKLQPNSNILEIGTKYGGSAIIMAAAIKDGMVYTIDINATKQAEQNTQFLTHKIKRIVGDAYRIKWDTPLGLLHIDGHNTLDAVKEDFERFGKFVSTGGYLIIHNIIVNDKGILNGFITDLEKKGWKTVEKADESVVLQLNV